MRPVEELRVMMDELGVEYVDSTLGTIFWGKSEYEQYCDGHTRLIVIDATPEQAIAATVGRHTDLSKRLREVTGLHTFAELFGFSWEDGSDWNWHDVACAMADAVDAATVGAGTCEPWDMRSNHAVQAANEQKVDERNTVPETKYLMVLDEAREASKDAERWERIARDRKSMCESLKETNADLRRIIKRIKEDK